MQVEGGAELLEARDDATAGWFSPHYGERIASRYVEASRSGAPLVTHIRPTPSPVRDGSRLRSPGQRE